MSADNENTLPPEAILEDLKAQADRLGLTYHPSIGPEKLREKIKEFKDHQEAQEQAAQGAQASQAPTPAPAAQAPAQASEKALSPVEVEAQKAARRKRDQRKEALKLVRVHISCMNPMKKEWPGEIFTFANRVVGEIKRFVPFNTDTHVENCILQMLKDRNYQNFVNVKGPTGTTRRGQTSVEFGIRELDPLTEVELKELARRQAMAAGKEV